MSYDDKQFSILIVDDIAINRMVMNGLMKSYGYFSIEAKDGQEGLNLVENLIKTHSLKELKLVMMDLQMPIMNGIEATQEILSICRGAKLDSPPIIGISADSSEEDRRNFLKSGIKEFCSKPIDRKKIQYLIDKYIMKK